MESHLFVYLVLIYSILAFMRYAKNRPKRAVFLHERANTRLHAGLQAADSCIYAKKRPFHDKRNDSCFLYGILNVDKMECHRIAGVIIDERFVLQYKFQII